MGQDVWKTKNIGDILVFVGQSLMLGIAKSRWPVIVPSARDLIPIEVEGFWIGDEPVENPCVEATVLVLEKARI